VFDKEEYLECIGYSGSAEVGAATLRELHRRHLMSIPYDTGYAIGADYEDFDLDPVFDAVVPSGRGGMCLELNFLFHRLLLELGFDVQIMSASTLFPGGTWGKEIEHMVIRTVVDGEEWLVDVGHGGISIVEPLRLTTGESKVQDGIEFHLVRRREFHVLQYKTRHRDWRDAYRFKLRPRTIPEWARWRDDLPEDEPPPRRRRRVIENGQVTLTANLFLSVEDGVERLRLIRDEDELKKIVSTYWR
jgi:amide synthase